MAATGACFFSTVKTLPYCHRNLTSASGNLGRQNGIPTWRLAVSAEQFSAATKTTTSRTSSEGFEKKKKSEEHERTTLLSNDVDPEKFGEEEERRKSLKDYFEEAKDLIRSDGGPPRWFSPLECGAHSNNSPLLLFLPGFDGVGLGLIRHHHRLGKIFDIWCLHIPVMDRTTFTDLVKLVERVVRSENDRSPNRPIYLVGESLGGCLALEVAARNPEIDLVLILANPATSFSKSPLQHLIPLLEVMPDQLHLRLPHTLSLMTGAPLRMVMDNVMKGLTLQQTVGEISQDLVAGSSYLSVLADILPRETLIWKLKMLRSASSYANSRLQAVKAQTLILSRIASKAEKAQNGNIRVLNNAKDQLLPSEEEGKRLCSMLSNFEMRKFDDNGHFLFLEDGVDLVTIIKGTYFFRRGKYRDCTSDFMPPTPFEFEKNINEPNRWFVDAISPVMLSTLEDGKIVKGLAGIPSDGPVLFVGYHMLRGIELMPLFTKFMIERNILLRGIAHPMVFTKAKDGGLLPGIHNYDTLRLLGIVPVSATNLFKLLSSKSHVLLYPGGTREATHGKGEQYKLCWPEKTEFVRMAAKFGATIIPFGAVGEDDIGEVVFDFNDLMKMPYIKDGIRYLMEESRKLRTDGKGEVANQQIHMPGILPKVPGRFYFYFGKPIETSGRKQVLRDGEKAQELYLQVKSEVEKCIAYLKEKREHDPYRNILPRLTYQVAAWYGVIWREHSSDPTFGQHTLKDIVDHLRRVHDGENALISL